MSIAAAPSSLAREHTLTAELVAHSALSERAALLARAEARAALRMQKLQFVDTRPVLTRSEAFAEDLAGFWAPPAPAAVESALMRGLAGVAPLHLAGMMAAGSALPVLPIW